jgi:hypothetical protein
MNSEKSSSWYSCGASFCCNAKNEYVFDEEEASESLKEKMEKKDKVKQDVSHERIRSASQLLEGSFSSDKK